MNWHKTSGCEPPRYQCSTGECISEEDVCDGTPDCPTGEEEDLPQCNTGRVPCAYKLFCNKS
jgi:hypothetical protein